MINSLNATRIRELEARQELLDMDHLDGGDMVSVLVAVADHDGYGDLLGFLDENDTYARNLLEVTQSDPTRAYDTIREWAEIDRAISNLDNA